jgi:hypothetical protein
MTTDAEAKANQTEKVIFDSKQMEADCRDFEELRYRRQQPDLWHVWRCALQPNAICS